MNDINIRNMDFEDIDSIYEIEKVSFANPWSKESYINEINNKSAIYIVVEIDNKIIGYAGMWLIFDEAHITNVAVHPNFRNRNVGSRLIDELISIGNNKKIYDFTLEVRKSNEAAINLYNKYNFSVEGIRSKYYQDNKEDAYIMWRRK